MTLVRSASRLCRQAVVSRGTVVALYAVVLHDVASDAFLRRTVAPTARSGADAVRCVRAARANGRLRAGANGGDPLATPKPLRPARRCRCSSRCLPPGAVAMNGRATARTERPAGGRGGALFRPAPGATARPKPRIPRAGRDDRRPTTTMGRNGDAAPFHDRRVPPAESLLRTAGVRGARRSRTEQPAVWRRVLSACAASVPRARLAAEQPGGRSHIWMSLAAWANGSPPAAKPASVSDRALDGGVGTGVTARNGVCFPLVLLLDQEASGRRANIDGDWPPSEPTFGKVRDGPAHCVVAVRHQ
jgi:hypothetical protein